LASSSVSVSSYSRRWNLHLKVFVFRILFFRASQKLIEQLLIAGNSRRNGGVGPAVAQRGLGPRRPEAPLLEALTAGCRLAGARRHARTGGRGLRCGVCGRLPELRRRGRAVANAALQAAGLSAIAPLWGPVLSGAGPLGIGPLGIEPARSASIDPMAVTAVHIRRGASIDKRRATSCKCA